MNNYEDVVVHVTNTVSSARSTEYLVKLDEFKRLFDRVSERQRGIILEWVKNLQHEQLRAWMKESILRHDEMPVRKLRGIARQLAVRDAHMMRKDELLSHIYCKLGLKR